MTFTNIILLEKSFVFAIIMAKLGFTVFLLLLSVIGLNAQYEPQLCTTPQFTSGYCVGIRSCPPLLSILQSRPLSAQAIDYLRRSQCGFEGTDPSVCCPIENRRPGGGTRPGGDVQRGGDDSTNTGPTNPGTNNNAQDPPDVSDDLRIDLSQNSLLPADCGKDLTQKIVGGSITEIDEFPWMVLLEYRLPNGRVTTGCGGVLISRRYVLTASHCVNGKDVPSTWTLASVRLGEYDTTTNPDCVQDDEDVVCADEVVSIPVAERIPHEAYKPLSRDQRNDIALLRLSRDVTFTSFIKPICLPSSLSFGEMLFVAGWGKTENNTNSNIKLKLNLPLADKTACARLYSNSGIRLGNSQICAGGERGKDSCRGDSGGPLMALGQDDRGNARFSCVGVVSFGPTPCGMPGWPGVYTRVIDYVPWILSKLRP